MASASARRAWNDAMKATAGAAALPPALQGRNVKRRSDRHKQDRRTKARKANVLLHSETDVEAYEFKTAVWVDALEGGVDNSGAANGAADDDGGEYDDEYDELEELQASSGDAKKRKRGSKGTVAANNSRKDKRKKSGAGVMPKRFLPRSLASILMDEANRGEDGVALAFLAAEARVIGRGPVTVIDTPSTSDGTTRSRPPVTEEEQAMQQSQRPLPRRKFCPVTGLLGIYTDPKSGIPYASMRALEQIRERAPPWMTLHGSAAYYETVKSIRDD